MNQPLLCPFCASEDVDPVGWLDGTGKRGPECMECGATAPTIEIWNQRRTAIGKMLEHVGRVETERDTIVAKLQEVQQLADQDRVDHPIYGEPDIDFVSPGWKSAIGRDLHWLLRDASQNSLHRRDARMKVEGALEVARLTRGEDWKGKDLQTLIDDYVKGVSHSIEGDS